jgi:hypothetical protein
VDSDDLWSNVFNMVREEIWVTRRMLWQRVDLKGDRGVRLAPFTDDGEDRPGVEEDVVEQEQVGATAETSDLDVTGPSLPSRARSSSSFAAPVHPFHHRHLALPEVDSYLARTSYLHPATLLKRGAGQLRRRSTEHRRKPVLTLIRGRRLGVAQLPYPSGQSCNAP